MAGHIQSESNGTFENKSTNVSDHNVFHPYVTVQMRIQVFMYTTIYICNALYGAGFIANLILVIYIIRYRRYRSAIFVVILSLGIADGTHCVGAILWMVYRSVYAWAPYWMCQVTTAIEFTAAISSNFNIAAISAIRFYQLVFPLLAHVKLTVKIVAKICSAVWIKAILLAVVCASFAGTVDLKDSRGDFKVCTYIGRHQRVYEGVRSMWIHLFPLEATVVLQFMKHVLVRKQVSSVKEVYSGQKLNPDVDSRMTIFEMSAMEECTIAANEGREKIDTQVSSTVDRTSNDIAQMKSCINDLNVKIEKLGEQLEKQEQQRERQWGTIRETAGRVGEDMTSNDIAQMNVKLEKQGGQVEKLVEQLEKQEEQRKEQWGQFQKQMEQLIQH